MSQLRPPLGELLSRLVGGRGTRGLSGDADRVLPLDAEYDFFADGLRRHRAEGDPVEDPELLWSTASIWARSGGLQAHLREGRDSGSPVLGFTDVAVIVSESDWRRGLRQVTRPWGPAAEALLRTKVRGWCADADLHPLFPERPVQVRVVPDGAPELNGGEIGLEPGEFVTALLPNWYSGPQPLSRPVISFHLHIPKAWEGYREVGRLQSDQMLFTLGSHWLDNFQHTALQVPALYRLQRYGDGSFVHVINPELSDEVRIVREDTVVSSFAGQAPNVLALRHNSGANLAWLVLALVDELAPTPTVELPELSLDEVTGSVPASGPSTGPVVPPRMTGHRTVVPVDVDDRIATLRERGVLLQRVHFSRFMVGYDVYIGENGEVGTRMEQPAATVSVRRNRIGLTVHRPGLKLDRSPMRPGQTVELEGDHRIGLLDRELRFRDLRGVEADGWPYLAEIRRPGGAAHLVFGSTHSIGRQPRCAVRLPDQPHNGNIVWRSKYADAPVISSRNGEIPKSRFSIDSIMVSTEHAALDLGGVPRLRCLARHCYAYVRRNGAVFSLSPSGDAEGRHELELTHGDELLIGNCAFRLRFPQPGRESTSDESLTAEELASAVDDLGLDALDDPRPPLPERGQAPGSTDLPAAQGLGERGPQPSRLSSVSPPPLPSPAQRVEGPPMLVEQGSVEEGAGENAPEQPVEGPPMLLDDGVSTRLEGPPMLLDDDAPARVEGPPMLVEDEDAPGADRPTEAPTSAGGPAEPPATAPVVGPPMLLDPAEPPRVEGPPMLLGDGESDQVEDALAMRPTVQAPLATVPDPAGVPEPGGGPAALPEGPPPPIDISDASVSFLPPEEHDTLDDAFAPVVGAEPESTVAVVDEEDWKFELGRRARLRLVGWMVSREVLVGNHDGAEIVLPENRSEPEQRFSAADYFRVACRGRRLRVLRCSEGGEGVLLVDGVPAAEADRSDGLALEVVRRDALGQEDFRIRLRLAPDDALPDPRALFLALDDEERMVRAMFTLGLPLHTARIMRVGPVELAATWTGDELELADYLESYQREDGRWQPFFVQSRSAPFRTVPEDGRVVRLRPGDRVLAGAAVYVLEAS